MLNLIWISFFLLAFLVCLAKLIFWGQTDIFVQVVQATFEMSKLSFEISLGLVGVMSFWLGIMRVGEKGGFLEAATRFLQPLFQKIFPDIPKGHPAFGAMLMNVSANMLGLDNAATPMGLKAMGELQSLNPQKESASDSQILFLVINTSSVTLFPVTIFFFRAQQGAADPTDVFIPILIATFVSSLVGLISVAWVQRINLLDKTVLAYLGGMAAGVGGLLFYFSGLDQATMQAQSAFISNFILFSVIVFFISGTALKRINVYDEFIEGAKEGFKVAINIVPFLVAMLVAIGVFRASGALDMLLDGVRWLMAGLGWDLRFIEALPTALMKPLSGSGARSLMIETMQTHGADSFAGRLASVVQGSTETTFYVIAVYFGAVGTRHVRHAVACGLLADAAGILTAIFITHFFFG